MLLFILLPHLPHVFLRIISIHLMLLFILVLPQGSPFVLHFNTSHVTVYHGAQSNIVSIHADFNTSHVTVYRLFNIFSIASSSFQYISCYCLSSIGVSFRKSSVAFQYISCYCLSTNQNVLFAETRDFNTSHVTVYQPQCYQHQSLYLISIHLMLLFIRAEYIFKFIIDIISIHLMLLFIRPRMVFSKDY